MTETPVRGKRPKDRRRSIELAAVELFASQGFSGTGLADIAAKVGVTPAAIYRHFAGKDELLETIVTGSLTRMGDAAELTSQLNGLDARARLERTVAKFIDLGHASPDEVTIYIRERHLLHGDALRRRREGEARVAAIVRGLVLDLEPGISPQEMDMRLRALNGVLASAAVRRHAVPLSRLRTLYVEGITAVLLAPPDARAEPGMPGPRDWTPPGTRRADILEAAAKLFRLYGYTGAAIDQIGAAVGIAGPTVYGTYPSKVDILVDAVDHAVAVLEVLTERALARATSSEEAIRLLAESYADTILTNLDIVAVAGRDIGHLPDDDRARIGRRQEDYRQRAQRVLLELRPELSEADARTLLAGAYALVAEVALARQAPSVDWTADLMARFLLAGADRSS